MLDAPATAAERGALLDKATFFQMESVSNPENLAGRIHRRVLAGFVDMTRDQNQANCGSSAFGGERLRQLTMAPGATPPLRGPPMEHGLLPVEPVGSSQIHVMWSRRERSCS